MNLLAYIELDAFGVMILLLLYFSRRRSGTDSVDDKCFSRMLLYAIAVQVLDAMTWLLDGLVYPGARPVLVLVTNLYYGLSPILLCTWTEYCDFRVYADRSGLRRRTKLYRLPLMIYLAILAVNLFVPVMFEIDAANVYHRLGGFFAHMALLYVYLVWSFFLVLHAARRSESAVERREYRYMLMFIVPPVVGGVIQAFAYGTSLVWACTVISILIIYINVQNRQISTDSLTGLNNRRQLERYLNSHGNAADSEQLYAVMIDADRFKHINDTYGHAAGDRALIHIAAILKSVCMGSNRFIARLGGDEFVIVGEGNDDERDRLLVELQRKVEEFNQRKEEPFAISLSVGTARLMPMAENAVDDLLREADDSMYRAKQGRKREE